MGSGSPSSPPAEPSLAPPASGDRKFSPFRVKSAPCISKKNWVRSNSVLDRSRAVVAKYGDKSVYFDLDDLGNTTGQWDVYGSDAPSPYNPLQVGQMRAGYRPRQFD